MRVYISGPIDSFAPGMDREAKLKAFALTEEWILANTNWEVVNPLKVPACPIQDCNPDYWGVLGKEYKHTWNCYLKYELIALLECDAVVKLPHAALSKGAQLETVVAESLGYDMFESNKNGEVLL